MENQNALANRIRKNRKQLKSFLAQNAISCYRLFDWDMPEFPLCIDVYEDKIHVSMYKTRNTLNDESLEIWENDCINTIADILQTDKEKIFVKSRERKKNTQYEKISESKEFFTVHENGMLFLVNLKDYLDTGLFLDHRNTRKKVLQESKGMHVLNLFAYTGSFSVYAATGGAFTTTTVDLSNTYLQWAKKNFILNEIPLSKHQFIKADAKEWIQQTPQKLYDIIILDPPTVSKSKMTKTNFDVQADHVEMINHTLKHLAKDGTLYFSNNYRDFVLDTEMLDATDIKNITSQSIPQDFRNKKIHACWQIRH